MPGPIAQLVQFHREIITGLIYSLLNLIYVQFALEKLFLIYPISTFIVLLELCSSLSPCQLFPMYSFSYCSPPSGTSCLGRSPMPCFKKYSWNHHCFLFCIPTALIFISPPWRPLFTALLHSSNTTETLFCLFAIKLLLFTVLENIKMKIMIQSSCVVLST